MLVIYILYGEKIKNVCGMTTWIHNSMLDFSLPLYTDVQVFNVMTKQMYNLCIL